MKKILVVLVLFLFGTVGMVAPAAAQRPALVSPVLRFSDQNGVPLAFGQLYSYQAGTTTPLSTYVDATTGALNTNPIVLDATGSTTVFLGANVYKFVLKDANGVIQWTADNIAEGMFQSSYVTSFNTRTGQVTSQTGDYTCAQVTGCISSIPTLYNQTIQVSGSSLPQEPALNLIPGVYGSVTSATVTAGGTLYTGAPTVTFTGGSCTAEPTGSSTVAGGAVTAVVMVTLGSGCTSAPTIAFSGGGGSGAAATANLIPSGITCVDQAGVSTNCTFVAGTGSGGGSGTSVVTNVTGSRAFGVTYQNTNTVPLLVMVTGSLWLDVGHLASIQARFGVFSPSVIGPTAAIMNSDGENSVTFLVPAGDFYGVYTNNGYPGESDSANLLNWVEGTLPLGGSGGATGNIATINGNSNAAQTIAAGSGVSVSSSGGTTTIAITSPAPALQTNGTANGTQTALNLVAGSNVTLANSGSSVTISATGGGPVASSATLYTANSEVQADSLVGSTAYGLIALGDSIFSSAGSAVSIPQVVCNYANMSPCSNYAVAGSDSQDLAAQAFSNVNPQDSGNPVVMALSVGNNVSSGAPGLPDFKRTTYAYTAWSAISATNKIFMNNASVTVTGTHTADSTYANAPGVTCTAGPCTFSYTAIVPPTGVFYLFYKMLSTGSTIAVTAAGSTVTDTVTGATPVNTAWTYGPNVATSTVGMARYAATPGSNAIVVTVGTGVTLYNFGFPPTVRYRSVTGPRIALNLGIQQPGYANPTTYYNPALVALDTTLVGDGLFVPLVDAYDEVDPNLAFVSSPTQNCAATLASQHPNQCAANLIAGLNVAALGLSPSNNQWTGSGGLSSPVMTSGPIAADYAAATTSVSQFTRFRPHSYADTLIGGIQVCAPDGTERCGIKQILDSGTSAYGMSLFETQLTKEIAHCWSSTANPTADSAFICPSWFTSDGGMHGSYVAAAGNSGTGAGVISATDAAAVTSAAGFSHLTPHNFGDTLIDKWNVCNTDICGIGEMNNTQGYGPGIFSTNTAKPIYLGCWASVTNPTSESQFACPIYATSGGNLFATNLSVTTATAIGLVTAYGGFTVGNNVCGYSSGLSCAYEVFNNGTTTRAGLSAGALNSPYIYTANSSATIGGGLTNYAGTTLTPWYLFSSTGLNMVGLKITNLANGVASTDAATVGQIVANPMTTLGDLTYGGAGGAPTRLAGPTTDGDPFVLSEYPSGSPVAPTWIDLTTTINTQIASQVTCNVAGIFCVTTYGGAGDAKTSTGSMTAGSAVLTDSSAPFTSAYTGKICAVNAAGAGSQGTTAFSQGITISAIASASSTTQITYTNASSNTQTLANGAQLSILPTQSTGGFASLTKTIFYYACSISGGTALLYTSPACTGNVTYPGSTGTGMMFFGDNQLVATATYTSSTTLTLATAAGTSASGVTYTCGTNNTTAFATAEAAAAAAGGGTVYFPNGTYMASGAGTTGPNITAVSGPLPVNYSNITVRGAGPGATTVMGGNWLSPVLIAYAGAGNLSNIQFRDMTVTYANAPGVRFGFDYSTLTVVCGSTSSYTLTGCKMDNLETFNDIQGLNIGGNCTGCRITNSYVHDGHANGISVFGSGTGFTITDAYLGGNRVVNRGDSLYAIDSITGSTVKGVTMEGNYGYNGSNACVEVIGVTSFRFVGGQCGKTFGAGIKVGAESGYIADADVTIADSSFLGIGTGTHLYGNNVQAYVAGVELESPGAGGIGGVNIIGNTFDSDGSNQSVNSYVGIVGSPAGPVKNVKVSGNHMLGGLSGTLASGQTSYGVLAGIDFEAGQNLSAVDNYLYGSYNDGLYTATATTGGHTFRSNIIDTPNTSAASSHYCYNLNGGSVVNYEPPSCLGAVTLAGNLNYTTLPATTIGNTFSAAGGFTSASLNGQAGTGVGATAWTVSSGTINVSTSTNSISCSACSSGSPATAYLPIKRRDAYTSVTIGTAPTTSTSAILSVGYDGTDTSISVNLYNLVVTLSTATLGGPSSYTSTAGDIVTVALQGNRCSVWYTRSSVKTLVVDSANCPQVPATSGNDIALTLLSTTPTIAVVNVAAP